MHDALGPYSIYAPRAVCILNMLLEHVDLRILLPDYAPEAAAPEA